MEKVPAFQYEEFIKAPVQPKTGVSQLSTSLFSNESLTLMTQTPLREASENGKHNYDSASMAFRKQEELLAPVKDPAKYNQTVV